MSRRLRHNAIRSWTIGRSINHLVVCLVFSCVSVLAHADELVPSETDYSKVSAAINETMRAHHYNPAELDTPHYRRIEQAVAELADVATSDEAFIKGFWEIWEEGPFSHVGLSIAEQSADDLANYLDAMRVGGGGAMLAWQADVAVLTVNTMMGLDTIEEIDAAYAEIAQRETSALIIDLRENRGGAFAVRPLVSHLLSKPVDAGGFISQPWNAAHNRQPDRAELEAVEPWQGWSIKAFWADVQTQPLTRITFFPTEPVFEGPVYVLTSNRTASAAELAIDAIKSANRATIIGENTAGEMLSQKVFDLPGGLQLSLPIADYYSTINGRIEGVGIKPDIFSDAADAFDIALRLLSVSEKTASEPTAPIN